MVAENVFLIHFICYWIMVYLYDKFVTYDWSIVLDRPIRLSLKNQILYTYPTINILLRYYPIKYDNLILSIGYLPLLVIIGDIYFYITHRPLHTKWFKYISLTIRVKYVYQSIRC